ncbi:unnamed protein product [Effrenium voratum]|nr:unnamed protein product [Effrenium voratum]
MARRCRRMVVLAFLTHVSLELCSFVGSWRAKSHIVIKPPVTVGADPAAALGAASASASLLDFFMKQVEYYKSNFAEVGLLSRAQDIPDHADKLVKKLVESQQRGQHPIILREQRIPELPVEGTSFEELMITLLNDNRSSGLSAAHAEPGVGKSIATALALQKCEKSAVSVLLQGEFTYSLEEFFRIPAKWAAQVAFKLFRRLSQRGIRLQMVLDNTFDQGLHGQKGWSVTVLMELTRFAHEFDHHLIVITQSEEAANEVDDLNGERTRKVEQSEAPFYRWSKEQAQKYLKTMTTLTKGVEEVLKMSEVPDKFGGWRPVSIKEYLRTGRRPKAPKAGSAATQIKPVWVRQLEQDDEKFVQIGSSFKVQGELADVDDVKEAIAQKKPNTVSCDADEIDIYSQKEGGWVREDEEAAVNRGKSRPSTRIRCL